MSKSNVHKRRGRLPSIEVVDLFCGIGGLSYGMKSKGLKILEGFDVDRTCKYAYETNNEAEFVYKDIRQVTKNEILPLYSKKAVKVLAGCAPCQPFSSYAFKNKNKDEQKYSLLYEFGHKKSRTWGRCGKRKNESLKLIQERFSLGYSFNK